MAGKNSERADFDSHRNPEDKDASLTEVVAD
jgi:hypothetical protein